MGASMLVPPARPAAPFLARLFQGPLGRILASEAGNTAGRGVTGQGFTPTGGGAFQQIIGETLFAPVGLALKARAAAQARAMAGDKAAFDKAMTDALNQMEQSGYKAEVQALRTAHAEQIRLGRAAHQTQKRQTMADYERHVADTEARHAAASGAHGESSAASIMDDWKRQVPAWESLPSSNRGVVDAVLGKGQRLVGQSFDAALTEAMAQAKGKQVTIPEKTAQALGFKVEADPLAGMSAFNRAALEKAGRLPPQPTGVPVDAAELMQRMTGQWEAKPAAYRSAADALVGAGFGNEAARAEYKAAKGLIGSVDRAKAIEYVPGVGHVFNPEKQLAGMSTVKQINELRRRGLGDIFEGPMQAIRGGPTPPPEIPKPVLPPFVPPQRPTMPARPLERPVRPELTETDLGIRTVKNPMAGHPIAGGLAGMGLSHSAGLGSMMEIPFILGYAGSNAMPKQLTLRAPLNARQQLLQRLTPGMIGELLRHQFATPELPTPNRPEPIPLTGR